MKERVLVWEEMDAPMHGATAAAAEDPAKPEAPAVPSARQQGYAPLPGQQWDRFEVALSKPSGKQKLGMVLKHAQVM